MKIEGKEIRRSSRSDKKYMVKVDGLWVHFGGIKPDGTPYGQFKDRTPLKLFKAYDSLDKKKRAAYHKRHNYTAKKNSPGYFSKKYLW